MKKAFAFLIIASALWAVPAVDALDVPEKPAAYVNDYAGVLSAQARSRLESALRSFDEQTSNQLVIAVFKGLEGGSLEDFSIRLAEKWKPGTQKRDNGVILLIFKDDREVRIEVGYGLEGALPDALCAQIIQSVIVPAFRAGDFDRGVTGAVEAIIGATQGEYKAGPVTDPVDDWIRRNPGWTLFILSFLVWLMIAKVLNGQTISGRRHSYWGGFGGGASSGRGFGGGGFSGGGGGFGGGGASGRW